jgi:hypothetical protein
MREMNSTKACETESTLFASAKYSAGRTNVVAIPDRPSTRASVIVQIHVAAHATSSSHRQLRREARGAAASNATATATDTGVHAVIRGSQSAQVGAQCARTTCPVKAG